MSVSIAKDDIFFITEAMKSRDGEGIYIYIDRETGEVLTGDPDNPLEFLSDEESENYEGREAEFDRRHLRVPHDGSGDSYQDMVDFIETVVDEQLQNLLGVAIQGQGAFGRFKGVLYRPEYESERERWFAFRDQQEYDRTVSWLSSEGFSVTP